MSETKLDLGSHSINTISVSKGVLYVSIHSTLNGNSFYRIKAKFYKKKKEILYESIEGGDDGKIDFEVLSSSYDKIKI